MNYFARYLFVFFNIQHTQFSLSLSMYHIFAFIAEKYKYYLTITSAYSLAPDCEDYSGLIVQYIRKGNFNKCLQNEKFKLISI